MMIWFVELSFIRFGKIGAKAYFPFPQLDLKQSTMKHSKIYDLLEIIYLFSFYFLLYDYLTHTHTHTHTHIQQKSEIVSKW